MAEKSDIKKIIGILEEFKKEDIKIALSEIGLTEEITKNDEIQFDRKINYSKLGWLPDLPDTRDYTFETTYLKPEFEKLGEKSIKQMLEDIGIKESAKFSDQGHKDLRKWCSPIEDQEDIGSCTANAGVGLVEYFERRSYNKHIDASRLFLYKVTRNLLNWTGDTGAYLRTTMGALRLFGVPPEKYWPYDTSKYDIEPNSFCYSFAQNYKAIQYYRLDNFFIRRDELLKRIKIYIDNYLPSMFGFAIFQSIYQANDDGKIPYPDFNERILGGHAVMAVGYNDKKKIKNEFNDKVTTGALLIRNSWGRRWGERGYGWLPYEYVLNRLAVDWWSILKNDWADTGKFGV